MYSSNPSTPLAAVLAASVLAGTTAAQGDPEIPKDKEVKVHAEFGCSTAS